MAKLGAVAFDKTGTLTAGRPQVTDVVGLRETSQGRLLEIAASVERLSEHPLARAIVEHDAGAHPAPAHDACDCDEEACTATASAACACGEAGCEAAPAGAPGPEVERFRAIPGAGVRAEIDGRLLFVGRPELLGVQA